MFLHWLTSFPDSWSSLEFIKNPNLTILSVSVCPVCVAWLPLFLLARQPWAPSSLPLLQRAVLPVSTTCQTTTVSVFLQPMATSPPTWQRKDLEPSTTSLWLPPTPRRQGPVWFLETVQSHFSCLFRTSHKLSRCWSCVSNALFFTLLRMCVDHSRRLWSICAHHKDGNKLCQLWFWWELKWDTWLSVALRDQMFPFYLCGLL